MYKGIIGKVIIWLRAKPDTFVKTADMNQVGGWGNALLVPNGILLWNR